MLLVTGGAGFIGANFVLRQVADRAEPVVNLDALTYAGNPRSLAAVFSHPDHRFVHGDIADEALVGSLLAANRPRAVVHFAAESHVDRSILGPEAFIQTNVLGTQRLLGAVLAYWRGLPSAEQERFRFLHVSTDEVYGSLEPHEAPFTELSRYAPNSPYAASKAAADHLVRAYHHTYGLPTLITNCSNNYGPRQFPEKLIPLVIHRALQGESLPIYGDGLQVRDWLYVEDHCRAIETVLERGRPGEVYNVGGRNEHTNRDVVERICALLDARRPRADGRPYLEQIAFVKDRPGHDRRYAIDATKMERELGWCPQETFDSGLAKTVDWYLHNQGWVSEVTSGAYRDWVAAQYRATEAGHEVVNAED